MSDAVESQHQITYTLNARDYAAMTRELTRRPLWRGAVMLGIMLVGVWCLVAYSTGVYDPLLIAQGIHRSGALPWFLGGMGAAVLLAVSSHWFAWAISFLYYRQLASADAVITLGLADDGIHATSSVANTDLPWASIKRVVRTRAHVFLPISRREALIMPRRAFASDAAFEDATRYARERMAAASQRLAPAL